MKTGLLRVGRTSLRVGVIAALSGSMLAGLAGTSEAASTRFVRTTGNDGVPAGTSARTWRSRAARSPER